MDISATSWFSDLGLEDSLFMDQCDIMDTFDEDLAAVLGDDFQCSLSPDSNSSSSTLIQRSNSSTTLCTSPPVEAPPQLHLERPAKQHKPNTYNTNSSTLHNMHPSLEQATSNNSPIILSFGNSNHVSDQNGQQISLAALNPEDEVVSEVLRSQGSYGNLEEATKTTPAPKKTGGRTRPPSQTYDHIIAERKRREQLSQRFVALSAIVPGLKKMDKTSVLGDAIKYLKHLQERVKTLEEQASKQTMESVVLVKKSQLLVEDEGSSDETGSSDEQPLPEIEARVCDKHILLRIHCEKHKGVLTKILDEVENLNLTVTNTSVSRFGTLALDITIIAEMEKDYSLTVKELVKSLRSALRRGNQKA